MSAVFFRVRLRRNAEIVYLNVVSARLRSEHAVRLAPFSVPDATRVWGWRESPAIDQRGQFAPWSGAADLGKKTVAPRQLLLGDVFEVGKTFSA